MRAGCTPGLAGKGPACSPVSGETEAPAGWHGPDVTLALQLQAARCPLWASVSPSEQWERPPPPVPPARVGQRPFTFFSPEGAAPGVEVSPGPELHLAATQGHRGAQAPRAGPTDSLGQVAAGWTGLFPTFLCNQVIQGQLACLHKGRRARPQLGRGRLLKGPAHPEAPPRGPSPSLPGVAHVDAAGATTTVADIVHCHVALPGASGRVEQAKPWPGRPLTPAQASGARSFPPLPGPVSPSGHWGGRRGVSAGRQRCSLRDLRQVASLSGPRFPWPHEAAAHAGSAFGRRDHAAAGECSFSTCCVPGTCLGPRDSTLNEADQNPASWGSRSVGGTDREQEINVGSR